MYRLDDLHSGIFFKEWLEENPMIFNDCLCGNKNNTYFIRSSSYTSLLFFFLHWEGFTVWPFQHFINNLKNRPILTTTSRGFTLAEREDFHFTYSLIALDKDNYRNALNGNDNEKHEEGLLYYVLHDCLVFKIDASAYMTHIQIHT